MTDSTAQAHKSMIKSLSEICKIDTALGGIFAERKKIEAGLASLEAQIKKGLLEREARARLLVEKKTRYQREEKSLKEEAERLVSRRKALGSLGNRKSLEKAGQEITFASKQLDEREEAMISSIDEIERLEADVKKIDEGLSALKESLGKAQEEARGTFINFEQRESDYRGKRAEFCATIEPDKLSLYDRIREKHLDAVTPVVNGSCASCYMQVAPQLVLEIQKDVSIVKCRGCGRILYIEDAPKEK